MKISKAIILSAGYGKRLNPLTLFTPKPLLEIKDKTLLENTINILEKYGIFDIWINTFYFSDQIKKFLDKKKFKCSINLVEEKKNILNTGGGIYNISNNFGKESFFVINPDTLWSEKYLDEFMKIEKFYFKKQIQNALLVVNKKLSFDKNLKGDFKLENNILKDNGSKNDYIYIGLQIMSNRIFKKFNIKPFPMIDVWRNLLKINQLYGIESFQKFLHITDLEIYKKLKN